MTRKERLGNLVKYEKNHFIKYGLSKIEAQKRAEINVNTYMQIIAYILLFEVI